jgi:methylamine---glutamate N-methyltransferase subunit C
MKLTTLARACGKSNIHHLERKDLVALTVEAAAMAKIPLAGTAGFRANQIRERLVRG